MRLASTELWEVGCRRVGEASRPRLRDATVARKQEDARGGGCSGRVSDVHIA